MSSSKTHPSEAIPSEARPSLGKNPGALAAAALACGILACALSAGSAFLIMEKVDSSSNALEDVVTDAAPAASSKQLLAMVAKCPADMLPPNPEMLTSDDADRILASCVGPAASKRQAAIREVMAARHNMPSD